MMNDMYEPNASQTEQAGMAPYGQPMPGMGAGSDNLFQILWRGRWLILLCLLLAGGGIYAYLQLATPKYTSTARLLVDKPNPQSRSDAPQPAGSTLINYLATQANMVMSPEIVARRCETPTWWPCPRWATPIT